MNKLPKIPFWMLAILAVLLGVFVLMIVLFRSADFGSSSKSTNPNLLKENSLGNNEQSFVIRKISVDFSNNCETLEIKINGEAKQIECDDTYIENRTLLSNETIQNLFSTLSKEDFLELFGKYYVPGLQNDLTLTIETSFGTKTVVLSGSDNNAPEVTDELEEIIEVIEEIEEDLDEPDPSAPPSIPPTPTPAPGSTPTPGPTSLPGTSPTPTPVPDPGSTPEPFRCDMLDQTGVTVSNIRCLDDEDTAN